MDVTGTADREAILEAERRAEEDAKVWENLQAMAAKVEDIPEDLSDVLVPVSEAVRPINRAERRAMVAQFKANLKLLPRVTPTRNATIIPKAQRRRKKS